MWIYLYYEIILSTRWPRNRCQGCPAAVYVDKYAAFSTRSRRIRAPLQWLTYCEPGGRETEWKQLQA